MPPTSPRKPHRLLLGAIFLFANGFFVAKVPDATRPELQFISSIFVLVLAAPSFWALKNWLGLRATLTVLLWLAVFAVAVESFALKTGFPYGRFDYGDKIGFKVAGLVPWTVPFAWSPLLLASGSMASRFSGQKWRRLAWSALLVTLLDAVLDPGAVSQGFWQYQNGGFFYGVPLSNFAGWLLSGFLGAWLLRSLVPHENAESTVWPLELCSSAVLILAFWTSVCLFSGLWAPAVLGALWLAALFRLFYKSPALAAHSR